MTYMNMDNENKKNITPFKKNQTRLYCFYKRVLTPHMNPNIISTISFFIMFILRTKINFFIKKAIFDIDAIIQIIFVFLL